MCIRDSENLPVVDAGEDDRAFSDIRFVLLALLDRRISSREVIECREPLHPLGGEVPVRHRMTDRSGAESPLGKHPVNQSTRLALACPGSNRRHGAVSYTHLTLPTILRV